MSTLLVTGGAGFIGSNFVRHVLENTDHSVTVLDALTYAGNESSLDGLPASRFRLVEGSICDPRLVDGLVAIGCSMALTGIERPATPPRSVPANVAARKPERASRAVVTTAGHRSPLAAMRPRAASVERGDGNTKSP